MSYHGETDPGTGRQDKWNTEKETEDAALRVSGVVLGAVAPGDLVLETPFEEGV
jgi:hypothetical protein